VADGNSSEVVSFQIKQNAHAMHVLSTSLYKRAEEAVVRELVCNAVDATKAAGSAYPVVVDLTNPEYGEDADLIVANRAVPKVPGVHSIGRCFVVYDRGTGLCAEDVKALVTVYFGSSKDQNDSNQTGFFGLGAKSPFAVCSEFYISSRWYGAAVTFRAYKDPNTGIPCIEEVYRGDTADENGLTFVVPFHPRAGAYGPALLPFSKEQVSLGTYFGTTYSTNAFLKAHLDTALFSCEYGHIIKTIDGSALRRALYAIYKNVLYPIENLVSAEMLLLNNRVYNDNASVILEIPSSVTLDVLPSREELRNSATNIAEINKIVDGFKLKLIEKLDNAVDLDGDLESWYRANQSFHGLNAVVDAKNATALYAKIYQADFAAKQLILSGYLDCRNFNIKTSDNVFYKSIGLANAMAGIIFVSPIPASYVAAKNFTKLYAAINAIKNSSEGAKYKTYSLLLHHVESKEEAEKIAKSLKLEKYVYFDWKQDLLPALSKKVTSTPGTLGKIKVYEATFNKKLVIKRFDASGINIKDHLWAFCNTNAAKNEDRERELYMDSELTVPYYTAGLLGQFPNLKIISTEYAESFAGETVGQHIQAKLKELAAKIEAADAVTFVKPPSNTTNKTLLDGIRLICKRTAFNEHKWVGVELQKIARAIALEESNSKNRAQLSDALAEYHRLSSISYNQQLEGKQVALDLDFELNAVLHKIPLLNHVSTNMYYRDDLFVFSNALEATFKNMGLLY
jgi:hypothetical protein